MLTGTNDKKSSILNNIDTTRNIDVDIPQNPNKDKNTNTTKNNNSYSLTNDEISILENYNSDTMKEFTSKSEKNYLFSKEATKLVIDNYDDLVPEIKENFLSYLIENLTEYYIVSDLEYVNGFLFKEDSLSITEDLIKKILQNRNSMLFDYYLTKTFSDEIAFEYKNNILKILNYNPKLIPKDLRFYYANNLHIFFRSMSIDELESYFLDLKKSFKTISKNNFAEDLYISFVIPSLQNKIKDMPSNTMSELEIIYNLINKHPDLKYNRYSRILLATYNLLKTRDYKSACDSDIIYDVQDKVENLLMQENILDYNLIYFCSIFEDKANFRKNLNLIINILEGTNTITISKTKYEKIKEKTVEESLSYLEWVLTEHHGETLDDEFYNMIKDFISYNWNTFTTNNKTFINMKSKLKNFASLDKVIEEIRSEILTPFQIWKSKYGALIFTSLITFVLFCITSFLSIQLVNRIIEPINNFLPLVIIITAEVIIAALLIVVMVLDKREYK